MYLLRESTINVSRCTIIKLFNKRKVFDWVNRSREKIRVINLWWPAETRANIYLVASSSTKYARQHPCWELFDQRNIELGPWTIPEQLRIRVKSSDIQGLLGSTRMVNIKFDVTWSDSKSFDSGSRWCCNFLHLPHPEIRRNRKWSTFEVLWIRSQWLLEALRVSNRFLNGGVGFCFVATRTG